MRVRVMCHRPRTQRLGEDSEDREIIVLEGNEPEARKAIKDLREAQAEMIKMGYPWPGGLACGFQTGGCDEFYMVIVEEDMNDSE